MTRIEETTFEWQYVQAKREFRFWCKDKAKENKAHIFLAESYLMLQSQTIDG